MTGRTFDGRQAAAMGLVNASVPLAELRGEVESLARELLDEEPGRAARGEARLQALRAR